MCCAGTVRLPGRFVNDFKAPNIIAARGWYGYSRDACYPAIRS